MTVFTEKQHAASCIISMAEGNRSVDNILVKAGNVVDANTVLGKLTSGGQYIPYVNGASDGSQTAVGIAMHYVDATAGDTPLAVLTRDCEVIRDELLFPSGTSGGDKTAAYADLAVNGVIVRGPSGFGAG